MVNVETDRRRIDWRLGWIDRRRRELETQLADLDRQECEVLGLQPPERLVDEKWSPMEMSSTKFLRVGVRVQANKNAPANRSEWATIVEVPYGKTSEWIGVRFDNGPGEVIRWHRNYFHDPRKRRGARKR